MGVFGCEKNPQIFCGFNQKLKGFGVYAGGLTYAKEPTRLLGGLARFAKLSIPLANRSEREHHRKRKHNNRGNYYVNNHFRV